MSDLLARRRGIFDIHFFDHGYGTFNIYDFNHGYGVLNIAKLHDML